MKDEAKLALKLGIPPVSIDGGRPDGNINIAVGMSLTLA